MNRGKPAGDRLSVAPPIPRPFGFSYVCGFRDRYISFSDPSWTLETSFLIILFLIVSIKFILFH
jgi:hypothetical protein